MIDDFEYLDNLNKTYTLFLDNKHIITNNLLNISLQLDYLLKDTKNRLIKDIPIITSRQENKILINNFDTNKTIHTFEIKEII